MEQSEPSPLAPAAPRLAGEGGEASVVLIVEDDAQLRDGLQRLLARAGFPADAVGDAPAALERLARGGVGLVLLDLMLPGMNGFELCRRLRALDLPTYLPIIMLTARVDEESRHSGFAAGADDYVTKPFNREELLDRVQVWLRTGARLAEASRGQRWLAAIVEGSCDAIIGGLPDGTITSWNGAASQLFGYSAAEALGTSFLALAPPEVNGEIARAFERVRDGERVAHLDTRQRHKDGRLIDVSVALSPVCDADERVVGVSTIVRDVSARRRAELTLHLQSEITRRMTEGVCLVRVQDNTIVYVNPRFEQMFGYPAGALQGQSAVRLHASGSEQSGERALRELGAALATRGETSFELPQVRRDGTTFWSRGRAARFEHPEHGPVWLMVQQDATEQRQLEHAVQQAQRMDAVGQLAGGIAHEFNNLLTIIIGFTELLQTQLPPEHPQRAFVDEIAHASGRAEAVTQQLLAFSRRQLLQPRVIDLNAVAERVSAMLRPLLGEHIALATQLASTPCLARVDPSQLEQVILHLAVNARDAMPAGGLLTLGTEQVEIDEPTARQQPGLKPGPYTALLVTDTGVGMDEATLARMFEPFFSTKAGHRGGGLGLAMVYGIVKQSDGYITASSAPHAGTSFRILLPPAVAEPAPQPSVSPELTAARGRETLLLVEDEPGVRALAATVLRSHGYEVLSAGHAEDALGVAGDAAIDIDLLVTDVVMPGMSGRQLADRLRPARPTMKVLYISGYTEDTVLHHGVVDEGTHFLPKPFTPQGLAQKVRAVLDGGQDRLT